MAEIAGIYRCGRCRVSKYTPLIGESCQMFKGESNGYYEVTILGFDNDTVWVRHDNGTGYELVNMRKFNFKQSPPSEAEKEED
jgi:hypothetical protein